MTPDEVGARLVALVADAETSVSGGGDRYARATVDVAPGDWPAAVRAARDDPDLAMDFFDWLSAIDELGDGFRIVAHLWSTRAHHGVLVRTMLPAGTPAVDSIVDVYPGASWHERETAEMFGISFTGHPHPEPLLLPPEFEGHPLRKDFVLASRVAKQWPGAKEPGEPHGGGARRQPMRPPGVPDDWGPAAGADQGGEEPARPRRRPPAASGQGEE